MFRSFFRICHVGRVIQTANAMIRNVFRINDVRANQSPYRFRRTIGKRVIPDSNNAMNGCLLKLLDDSRDPNLIGFFAEVITASDLVPCHYWVICFYPIYSNSTDGHEPRPLGIPGGWPFLPHEDSSSSHR